MALIGSWAGAEQGRTASPELPHQRKERRGYDEDSSHGGLKCFRGDLDFEIGEHNQEKRNCIRDVGRCEIHLIIC